MPSTASTEGPSGPEPRDERPLDGAELFARAALQGYGVLDTGPDEAFDDFVAVLARLTGAPAAAFVLHDNHRRWCKARFGDLPPEWQGEDHGLAVAGSIPVTTSGGITIGELLLVGEEPIDASGCSTFAAFAVLARELLEEHRDAAGRPDRPRWGVAVVSSDGRLRAVSPYVEELLGRGGMDNTGLDALALIHPDDFVAAATGLANTVAFPGEKFPLDLRFGRPDGTWRTLEVTAMARTDPDLDDIVFRASPAEVRPDTDQFVTDQSRVLALIGRGAPLEETLTELAGLVHRHLGSPCCVMVRDEAGEVLRPIGASGLPSELVTALDGVAIGPDSTTCGVVAHRSHAARCPDVASDRGWAEHRDTVLSAGFISCWSTPIRDQGDHEALGALTAYDTLTRSPRARDVRLADLCAELAAVAIQRSRAEGRLGYEATHDQLTGLANRALFLDRLEHLLSLRQDPDHVTAVMFLDLDRFKVINDALGHDVGDRLLCSVARRLRSVVRPSITVARFGGDEFTLLCPGLPSEDAALQVADRIVRAFREPIELGERHVVMTVSLGIALRHPDDDDPATLLRSADAALFRAKDGGRNRFEVFDEALRVQAQDRLALEHDLDEAVHRGDFTLAYQPEVDLDTDAVVGVEALLRWTHPERGPVSPAEFIPLAEETGAIVTLGDWVLVEACRTTAAWLERRPDPRFTTWVNVSSVQLLHAGFADRVAQVLEDTGLPPRRLGLEVTESTLLDDQETAIRVLAELRASGVQIALDDFGTGYSSLEYLRHLPVDVVKIDRSFITGLDADVTGAALVAAIVQLAHAVGCRVVAEGVEDRTQLAAVRALGCELAQGFGLGRPAPAGELPPTVRIAGVPAR